MIFTFLVRVIVINAKSATITLVPYSSIFTNQKKLFRRSSTKRDAIVSLEDNTGRDDCHKSA